jgi:acetyltransferase
MLDVDLGDLIDFFGADPQTRSIVLTLNPQEPKKFMSAARGFARTKPIIVVKAGRFGKLPLRCFHTWRTGGQDSVHDAAFRR